MIELKSIKLDPTEVTEALQEYFRNNYTGKPTRIELCVDGSCWVYLAEKELKENPSD